MSLPPLRPDKSTSGIIQDPQTLERVVPSSRRQDGTVRKEIKIRPGFTPQEDVGRFRSTRQQINDVTKNIVPGSAGRLSGKKDPYAKENPFKQDDFPGLGEASGSKAANKNAQRRAKKRDTKAEGGGGNDNLAWDEDDQTAGVKVEDTETQKATEAIGSLTLGKDAEPPTNGSMGGDKDPLGTGAQHPGGGAPEKESIEATIQAEDNTPWADQVDSPTEQALEAPPGAADVPETAAQAGPPAGPPAGEAGAGTEAATQTPRDVKKDEGAWTEAGGARRGRGQGQNEARGGGRGRGQGSGRGQGRGGSTGRGTDGGVQQPESGAGRGRGAGGGRGRGSGQRQTPGARSTPGTASQPSQPAPAPEPRVRKEVKVREGAAGAIGSLADRVRGLVVASQDGREKKGAKKVEENSQA